MPRPLLATIALCIGLIAPSCGGSETPAPSLSSGESEVISQAEAVEKARAAAVERGFSPDGLNMNPAELFGEWQVSFTPDGGAVEGGFLVVLDSSTGEFLDLVEFE